MNRRRMLLAAAALLCSACVTPPPERTNAKDLAGTTWRLVKIQSMDDSQGTTHPAAGQTYTVRFDAGGTAAFHLNCNRANARWTAEPQPDSSSGGLLFSGLAMTRAMCPSPSLDTRIARDMGFVRTFMIRGDTLSMSLMADGGIYSWSRTGD